MPLLVDIDTGCGSSFHIARTVKSVIKFGAAAVTMQTKKEIDKIFSKEEQA